MSFKRKTENIAFSVAITPDKKKKLDVEDTRFVAILAPFNAPPKISFEKIKLHSTAVREVYLVNPSENAIQVELNKVPDEARGYKWSETDFDLAKQSQVKLSISWTPSEYGSWHDSIKIINKKTKKPLSELKLSSSTEEPPKVSKRNTKFRSALTTKTNHSSNQKVVKKSSLVKIKSENKENESTFYSKSKNPTQSGVCIKYKDGMICESKKPPTNQTFTQISLDDLDEKVASEISGTCLLPVATNVLSQSSNSGKIEPTTPRRSTFNIVGPVVSRRSTYSLRNRQVTNIMSVEEEKNKFELLASPGIHNKSLEIAASKLGNPSIEITKAEDETELLKADHEIKPSGSTTFTVQPSVTYNVPKSGKLSPLSSNNFDAQDVPRSPLATTSLHQSPFSSKTFNAQDVPRSPLATTSHHQSPFSSKTFNAQDAPRSPLATTSLHQLSFCTQLLGSKPSERYSVESAVSSEKYYDSLEGNEEVEVENIEDLLANWDEVYDIDKFSSMASEKLLDKKGSSPKRFSRLEHSQTNLLHCKTTLSDEAQASSSNLQLELYNKNITYHRKPEHFPSMSSLSSNQVFVNLDNLISPKNLNQTKDTLMQLDEDFGKFNFSIASSSPVNLQNVLRNNLNRTYTPAKSNSFPTDYLEKDNEGNNEDMNFKNDSKYSKIINIDPEVSKNGHVSVGAEIKPSTEDINVPSDGTQNISTDAISTAVVEQTKLIENNSPDNHHPEIYNGSKDPQLKWTISPPQNNKKEESTNKLMSVQNFPKTKPVEYQTPVRLAKTNSSLSYLAANKNTTQLKDHHSLHVKTNRNKSTEHLISEKIKADDKNTKCTGTYSDDVFLVPQARFTRTSLQNGSPPKIRKISQEPKIKRLSTPSMSKKLTTSCTTEIRKQKNTEVLRSLPRSATLKKRKSLKVADWVPAVRKLKLSFASSQSEEEIGSPVDLATPDPFLAATTLNPFAKGGLYLNNKWLKEQEVELIQWADRMLRPPNELELDRDQSGRNTLHRLNALRATAFNILTSPEVATVLSKVKRAVEKNIISIRSDRQLHADLGLQDKIICLLMSYNPLWLRLCLEAVYQCNIELRCHSDEAGLRDFIRRYVLNDEYLRQMYSHPTVPHLMQPQFEDEMKKFSVYKFLVIVYLLDLVKSKKVILHDPCLFKKDSQLKSSKDILIEFNKNFVAGAGDITRILRSRSYEVSHCQSYIDEFDFSLTSTKELRDGVRLTRLAENLTGDKSLCSKLRVPAVSNLQKKFNADVAFSALKKAGYDLPLEVSPKDISDGHIEKTLSFLWHLRGIFQKRAVLLIVTKWRETKQLRADRKKFLRIKNAAIQIQRWYRKIKKDRALTNEELRKGHEARENFLKLKIAVVSIQRRFRKRKEERDLKKKCQAAVMIQKWYKNCKGFSKDRRHFKKIREAATTIQRAFRNYKSRKIGSELEERKYYLKIRTATTMMQRRLRFALLAKHQRQHFLTLKTAAIKIQRRFRANKEAKNQRSLFLAIKCSTIKIQRKFKALLIAKHQRQDFLIKKKAATTIQKRFRAFKQGKWQRNEFLKIRYAVVTIQKKYRAALLAKHLRGEFLKIKAAALFIQRRFKANKEAKRYKDEFCSLKIAVVIIQRRFRAYLLSKAQRKCFIEQKQAVILLQRKFRCRKLVKKERERFLAIKAATLVIQRRYRANKQCKIQKDHFVRMKSATLLIQRRFREYLTTKRQRKYFLAKKTAAIQVQRRFRANKQAQYQRKLFMSIKAAVVAIQIRFRDRQIAKQQRQHFLKLRSAAVIVQKRYREYKLAKLQRTEFTNIREAVIRIQKRYKAFLLAKKERQLYISTKTAAIAIQRKYRANKEAKTQRKRFVNEKNAAIIIQRRFRSFLLAKHQRQNFLTLKAATIVIQRRFRGNNLAKSQRKEFISIKTAVVTVQRRFKAFLLSKHQRQDFLTLKAATIVIQRRFRGNNLAKSQRKEFIAIKTAAVTIQRRFRASLLAKHQRQDFHSLKKAAIVIQRRFRANKLAKSKREELIAIKTAAVTIQRRFRASLLAKHQRQDFHSLKAAAIVIQRRFRANKLAKSQRKEFISIKTAAVTIQRRFKALLLAKHQRQGFLTLKAASIVIQRRFRANKLAKSQRKEFISIKTAVVTIQRRFKDLLLAKQERQYYLKLISATIKIQRTFRSKKLERTVRKEFAVKQIAAVKIQRKFREYQLVKKHKSDFLAIKAAAITIQRKYRGYKSTKKQREEFLRVKNAVVNIQRKFRSFQLAKIQRQKFLSTKTAAVRVQRLFRANLETKRQRNSFLELRNATISIQRRFRATLLGNSERNKFLALKAAAVIIQRRFRANKLKESQRKHFLAMRTSAVIIQTRFKAFLNSKHQRQEFARKKAAALTLQRRFRACKQAQYHREKYLELKSATITIQRRFRALLCKKRYRQEYLSLKSAAITIQRRFRAAKVARYQRHNFIRLKTAAVIVQRKFKENRRARITLEESLIASKTNAAVKIQAAWRGYLIRKTVTIPQPPKTKPACLESLTDKDLTISTRGKRYFSVLSNRRKYSVAELQNTLFNIDTITALSANQCEYYVRNGAVKILYEILVHQANRSFGVQRYVELILSILLNLYRAPATADCVWKETREVNGLFYIFDLLMRFKTEKTSTVFCKACTVIWLFAQDPAKAEVIMNTPKIQEIYKYIIKSMKKNELPSSSGSKQDNKKLDQSRLGAKKSVSGAKKNFPALRFNFGDYFDDLRAFDDKIFALESVMDKLNRYLKT